MKRSKLSDGYEFYGGELERTPLYQLFELSLGHLVQAPRHLAESRSPILLKGDLHRISAFPVNIRCPMGVVPSWAEAKKHLPAGCTKRDGLLLERFAVMNSTPYYFRVQRREPTNPGKAITKLNAFQYVLEERAESLESSCRKSSQSR